MSLRSRIAGLIAGTSKGETSGTVNPRQWFLDWIFGGSKSAAGVTVTPDSAMRCATVQACVQVIEQDVAKVPFILYRRKPDGGRERAVKHPLYNLVGRTPNHLQTAYEFRQFMQRMLCLRGNAYAVILRDGAGRPVQLLPQLPTHTTIKRYVEGLQSELFYEFTGVQTGEKITVPEADVLHIRDGSDDGVVGKSRITQAREAIGLALGAQEYGARFFANDATPPGVLIHPQALKGEAAANIKKSWKEQQGGKNRHEVAVLEEGMKYEQVGLSNEDAQFLDTRKYQRSEIYALWRIPAHKVGDLDKATFSNIEHQALEYVGDALQPWFTNWEQRCAKSLLSEKEQAEYYFEFLVDGLLRGDIKTRYEAYKTGIMHGFLSPNDVRDKENMNRIPNGDIYLQPVNLVELGTKREPKSSDTLAGDPDDTAGGDTDTDGEDTDA